MNNPLNWQLQLNILISMIVSKQPINRRILEYRLNCWCIIWNCNTHKLDSRASLLVFMYLFINVTFEWMETGDHGSGWLLALVSMNIALLIFIERLEAVKVEFLSCSSPYWRIIWQTLFKRNILYTKTINYKRKYPILWLK